MDAVAATAAGAATPALGADAVLAGVAGTVAEEGPKVVAAAQDPSSSSFWPDFRPVSSLLRAFWIGFWTRFH